MRRTHWAAVVAASVAIGLTLSLFVPHGPHYGTTVTRIDTPPTADEPRPSNEDALFAATIAGVIPPSRTAEARRTVHSFCAAMDAGTSASSALDQILSPLTTSQEVVEATAAIGGGVGTYCPEHLGAMLDMAHEMHGDTRTYTT